MSDIHVFVSDVHLIPGENETTRRFLSFLQALRGRVAAVHILGDLFHYWLGWGHEQRSDYSEILTAFRELADSGTAMDLIWGNRDFLVRGRAFERRTGIRLRGDEHRFTIGERRIKVVHGDLLCANDVSYQRYRAVIRSGPAQLLARIFSLSFKRHLADGLRRMSEHEVKRKSRKSMRLMDLDEQAVARLYADGSEVAVCGHIHREQHRSIALDDRVAELYVLGSWDVEAPFLVADEEGRFRFARDNLEGIIDALP